MAVRQDTAQLIISIDAKESVAYQKAVGESAALVKNIKSAQVGTKEYNDALAAQQKISKELAATDYTKLSLKNLQDRRKQLIELQKQLPQNVFAEKGFASELKQVNGAMKTAVDSTRATTNSLQQLDSKGSGFLGSFKKNVLGMAAGFAVFEIAKRTLSSIIGLGKESLELFDKQAKADAQLKAVLISTNGAAGRSFEELKQQASALQQITLFGDEQTQEAQAMLLTFTKVREEIFDRSIPAIQDYATAMGSDLKSASIQVGKALNDPIKGVTALGKAGVQFTESQKATIKSLVEMGDVAGAQKIILGELETQFKGSAEAAAKAGLGPYTQLSNRIGDVKEQFGELVEKGLKFAAPFFEKIIVFVEGFVGSLISGKKATGEFATGINFAIGVLKAIASIISFTVDTVGLLISGFKLIVSNAQRLPVVGTIIKAIGSAFSFIIDAVSNTSAVVAGLQAAFQQSFDNIKKYIQSGLATLLIFAKEAELLLTFDSKKRDQLKAEIKALETLKADAAKAGKTVGQAYAEARDEQLKKEAVAAEIAFAASKEKQDKRVGVVSPIAGDDEDGESTSSKKAQEKKKEREKEEKKDYDKLLKERLELIKDAFDKEQQIAEKAFLEGQITEEEFNKKKLESKRLQYENQLVLLRILGQQDTEEYRKIELDKLKIEKEITDERVKVKLEAIEAEAASEIEANERKFLESLITEEEREQMRLEILRTQAEEKLALLTELGLQETDAFKKVSDEKLKIQLDQHKKDQENEKRHQEIKKQLQEFGLQTFKDVISGTIDLLGQDEEARKKNAGLIKAFETARIIVAAQAEIAEIFKSVAGLGPLGWGIAGARALFVGIRSISSIAKIQSAKFSMGGSLKDGGVFRGPSHESGGVKFRYGDQLGEAEGDEIIINKRSSKAFAPVLDYINQYNGWGKKLFALGGSINPNTTPVGLQNVPLSSPSGSGQVPQLDTGAMDQFAQAVRMFVEVMPVVLSNIRATVVYSDIRNAANTVNDIENKSRF